MSLQRTKEQTISYIKARFQVFKALEDWGSNPKEGHPLEPPEDEQPLELVPAAPPHWNHWWDRRCRRRCAEIHRHPPRSRIPWPHLHPSPPAGSCCPQWLHPGHCRRMRTADVDPLRCWGELPVERQQGAGRTRWRRSERSRLGWSNKIDRLLFDQNIFSIIFLVRDCFNSPWSGPWLDLLLDNWWFRWCCWNCLGLPLDRGDRGEAAHAPSSRLLKGVFGAQPSKLAGSALSRAHPKICARRIQCTGKKKCDSSKIHFWT